MRRRGATPLPRCLGSLVRLETAGGNEERKRENGEEEEGGCKGKHRTCRGIASRMLPTWLSRSSIDTYRLVSPLCTTCTHDAWRNVDVSTGRVHDSTKPLTCSCVFQLSLVSSFMLSSSYMNMTHLWKLRFKRAKLPPFQVSSLRETLRGLWG